MAQFIRQPTKMVVRDSAATGLTPSVGITVAVDTAYVAAQGGNNISQGVYMMDNMLDQGSTGEAGMELHTNVTNGSLMGYHSVPINRLGSSGDTVVITGFTVEPDQNDVWTSAGYPQEQPALPNEPDGTYWIAQALAQGTMTYQIQIKVTVGLLHPVSYFINWDPFLTSS